MFYLVELTRELGTGWAHLETYSKYNEYLSPPPLPTQLGVQGGAVGGPGVGSGGGFLYFLYVEYIIKIINIDYL